MKLNPLPPDQHRRAATIAQRLSKPAHSSRKYVWVRKLINAIISFFVSFPRLPSVSLRREKNQRSDETEERFRKRLSQFYVLAHKQAQSFPGASVECWCLTVMCNNKQTCGREQHKYTSYQQRSRSKFCNEILKRKALGGCEILAGIRGKNDNE